MQRLILLLFLIEVEKYGKGYSSIREVDLSAKNSISISLQKSNSKFYSSRDYTY